MHKLINILIRHKQGRDNELLRCLKSVWSQTYNNYRIIVSQEDGFINSIEMNGTLTVPVKSSDHYNLHCNDLKYHVNDGWFFYLDDDDYLSSPGILEQLSYHLFEGALIVQFLRNGKPKPPNDMIRKKLIQRGLIGGGCMVLHHSFKDIADWKGRTAADYDWIKDITDQVPTRFIPLVLQITDNNGRHGK